MSTQKHVDIICVVIAALMLVVTVLFVNGEALGISVLQSEETADVMFTENDLNDQWNTEDATMITLDGETGTVNGNGAYISDGDVHIVYAGKYVLSGNLQNGSVIVDADGDDKVWLMMDGVTIKNDETAAIIVEQADKVFLTLATESENSIDCHLPVEETVDDTMDKKMEESEDSQEFDHTAQQEESVQEENSVEIDSAIFARDDLTINGSGSLNISSNYHGIVGKDDVVITGGNLEIEAAQDGIHANDSVRIKDGAVKINAGDDGITVSNDEENAFFYIEGGTIDIPSCYEGIEAIDVTIAGGDIMIMSTDDGINANGGNGGFGNFGNKDFREMKYGEMEERFEQEEKPEIAQEKNPDSESIIRITGGNITILNESGRDADGLDSNGDIIISGGNVFISVPGSGSNCAIDYASENGGVCEVNGGTVIACGGSGKAESFSSSSEQGFLIYQSEGAESSTMIPADPGQERQKTEGMVPPKGTPPEGFQKEDMQGNAEAEQDNGQRQEQSTGGILSVKDSEGNEIISKEIPYAYSYAMISSPDLKIGNTYILSANGTETEMTVDNQSKESGQPSPPDGNMQPPDGMQEPPEGGEMPAGGPPKGGPPDPNKHAMTDL